MLIQREESKNDVIKSMEMRCLAAILWDNAERDNLESKKRDWLARMVRFRTVVLSEMGSHARETVPTEILSDEFNIILKAVQYAFDHRAEEKFWKRTVTPFAVSGDAAKPLWFPLPGDVNVIRNNFRRSRAIKEIATAITISQLFPEQKVKAGRSHEAVRKQLARKGHVRKKRSATELGRDARLAQSLLASLALDYLSKRSHITRTATILDALFKSGYGMVKTFYLFQVAESAQCRVRASPVKSGTVLRLIASLPKCPAAWTLELKTLVGRLQ